MLVAFGVGSHRRRSYALWREGKAPDFVMEVASVSTWRRDRDEKPSLYESLGVREYFLYDPVGGRLEPRLQGHVLREGRYRGVASGASCERRAGAAQRRRWAFGRIWRGREQALRWHDPVTGQDLEDYDEVHAAREAAEARAQEADARAREEEAARRATESRVLAAEGEAAALRAELRRLRGEPGT